MPLKQTPAWKQAISEGHLKNRLRFDTEEMMDSYPNYPGEPVICSWFGCGKKLSIREQLFGKYCIDHSKVK